MTWHRFLSCLAIVSLVAVLGCADHSGSQQSSASQADTGDKKAEPKPAADLKRVPVGKNIVLEIQGDLRRVRMTTEVCLRGGPLEQLVTRNRIKDHEAILTANIDARDLHLALTLAGAEPGKPVQLRGKLAPPTGTTIKIFLEYKKDGKDIRVPAQQWIRNTKTKKDLHTDWVFAGSFLTPDPLDKKKPPYYRANDGDVITIVNFEDSCIDVPFLSTKDNADLDFEAHTERIPPLKTMVTVILEPVFEKKK